MNIWLKLRKTAAIALCELLAIATIFTGCASTDLSGTEGAGHAAGAVVAGEDSSGDLGSKDKVDGPQEDLVNNNSYVSLDAIPAYDGKAYVAVNNNEPFFTDSDMTTTAFENYSDLDSLGRCGVAYANICKDKGQVFIQSLSSYWLSACRRECQSKEPYYRYEISECGGDASV